MLTLIYQVAARVAGVELSSYELEFTKKSLGVKISYDDADDEARTKYADQIAAEDAALEAKHNRAGGGGCGCVVQ